MSSELAHRKFYDFDNFKLNYSNESHNNHSRSNQAKNEEINNKERLFRFVTENIIGSKIVFSSPYGDKRATYCDYTASGRSLKFIEDYITEQVLSYYGSTHTTTSITSLQTSFFRHEARDIIRNAVRASEHDRIIFTGSGTTGAINRLIHGMKFNLAPVVFVDFTAHHSSLLPWREIGSLVLRVRETEEGNLDMEHLESLLKEHCCSDRQLIGCFSAASNITGLILDDIAITILLHKYRAFAFWDFATAAPYKEIVMNPHLLDDPSSLAHKDAIFFSLHKFIGGVQTPGVLIAKKDVFRNEVPLVAGGGTVFFVSREGHRYLKDVEEREEGGTPPIVETIRGGMVMQLKMSLTAQSIMEQCFRLSRKVSSLIALVPELIPLGNVSEHHRLPILSFNVKHLKSGKLLHYNFVSAILNDVYGIQSRGGCACAGPYAQDLLGIDESLAQKYEMALREEPTLQRDHLRRKAEYSSLEVLRPGFVRINFSYTADDEQINFILSALKSICTNGWKLLPQYVFSMETGQWKHSSNLIFNNRQWLQNISYASGEFEARLKSTPQEVPSYAQMLSDGEQIFAQAEKFGLRKNHPDCRILFDCDEARGLEWFLSPFEVQRLFEEQLLLEAEPPFVPPFTPLVYPLSKSYIRSRPDYVWKNYSGLKKKDNFSLLIQDERNIKESNDFSLRDNIKTGNFHQSIYNNGNGCYFLAETDEGKDFALLLDVTSKGSEHCLYADNAKEDNMLVMNDSTAKESGLLSYADSNEKNSNDFFLDINSEDNEFSKDNIDHPAGTDNEDTYKDLLSGDKSCLETSDHTVNDTSREKMGQSPNHAGQSLKITNNLKLNKPNVTTKASSLPCDDALCFVEKRELMIRDITCDATPKSRWALPPKSIFNPMVEAIQSFNMLRPNDKVLVCLSGGKDSLSLLHTLRQYMFCAKSKGVNFSLGAVTVDPQSSSYDPRPLIPYLKSLDVPYFYEQQGILQQAMEVESLNSICSFCSRMKRGRIYAAARREGYNVLALGQHLDDLAESFLMSLFHNGRLRTMKASYTVRESDLRVIRPFVYAREKDLRTFAETRKLPIIPENCPACFESPKERHRVKQLLAQQEVFYPNLFWSLKTAFWPLLSINKTGLENQLFGKRSILCGEDEEEE